MKLIGPKNDPPTAVQEKVLSLIQSWASAFQGQPELSGVTTVYQDLLTKGIEFPPTDLDSLAPIHTPKRVIKILDRLFLESFDLLFLLNIIDGYFQSVTAESHPPITQPPQPSSPPTEAPSQPGSLAPEQRAKLQSELDVVQSNMTVLGEMLYELKPGEEQPDELELLQVRFCYFYLKTC